MNHTEVWVPLEGGILVPTGHATQVSSHSHPDGTALCGVTIRWLLNFLLSYPMSAVRGDPARTEE